MLPYWLSIHSLVGLWRRLGRGPTVALHTAAVVGVVRVFVSEPTRTTLMNTLGGDLGPPSSAVMTLALILAACSVWLKLAWWCEMDLGTAEKPPKPAAATPADDGPEWRGRGGTPESAGDDFILAKAYFDLGEYRRASHQVTENKSSLGRFLRYYSLYLAGEKRKNEEMLEVGGSTLGGNVTGPGGAPGAPRPRAQTTRAAPPKLVLEKLPDEFYPPPPDLSRQRQRVAELNARFAAGSLRAALEQGEDAAGLFYAALAKGRMPVRALRLYGNHSASGTVAIGFPEKPSG